MLGLQVRDTAFVDVAVLVNNRFPLFGIIVIVTRSPNRLCVLVVALSDMASGSTNSTFLGMISLVVFHVKPAIMHMDARNQRARQADSAR